MRLIGRNVCQITTTAVLAQAFPIQDVHLTPHVMNQLQFLQQGGRIGDADPACAQHVR